MASSMQDARKKRQKRVDTAAPSSHSTVPASHNAVAGNSRISPTAPNDVFRQQQMELSHYLGSHPQAVEQLQRAGVVPAMNYYPPTHMAPTSVGPQPYRVQPASTLVPIHHQHHYPHMSGYGPPPPNPQDQILRIVQELGGVVNELKTEVSASGKVVVAKMEALEAAVKAEKEANVKLRDQFRAFANAQATSNRQWDATLGEIRGQIGKGEGDMPIVNRLEAISFTVGDLWEKASDPRADGPGKSHQRVEEPASPVRRPSEESASLTKAADPARYEEAGVSTSPGPQESVTSTTLNEDEQDLGQQVEILLKSPKKVPTDTGASTPYSQLDDAEMDFEYPPDVEIVPDAQQPSREPTAELPSYSLSTTNPPTRMPCNEGSFSKVDWNAQTEENDEDSPSASPVPFFRPNLSPDVLRKAASYTSDVAEGSVAQLRFETLGESSFMGEEAAASSTPPAQTIPLVAPPAVPPLPSPASSRSPSPKEAEDDNVAATSAELEHDVPEVEVVVNEDVEMVQDEPVQLTEEVAQPPSLRADSAEASAAPSPPPEEEEAATEDVAIAEVVTATADVAAADVDEMDEDDDDDDDDHDELDMLSPRKEPRISVQPAASKTPSRRSTRSPSMAGTPLFLPTTATPSVAASRRATPSVAAKEATPDPSDDEEEPGTDEEELARALELSLRRSSPVKPTPVSSPAKRALILRPTPLSSPSKRALSLRPTLSSSPAKRSLSIKPTPSPSPAKQASSLRPAQPLNPVVASSPVKEPHTSSSSDAGRVVEELLAPSSPIQPSDVDEDEYANAIWLSMQLPSSSQPQHDSPSPEPQTAPATVVGGEEEMLPSPPASDVEYPAEEVTEMGIQLDMSRSVTPIPQKRASRLSTPESPEIPLPPTIDAAIPEDDGAMSGSPSPRAEKIERGRSPTKTPAPRSPSPAVQDVPMDDDDGLEYADEEPVVMRKSVSRSPSKRAARNIVTSPSPGRDSSPEVPQPAPAVVRSASRASVPVASPVAVSRASSSRVSAAPNDSAALPSTPRPLVATTSSPALPSSSRLSQSVAPQIKAEPLSSRFPNPKSERLPNTPRRPLIPEVIEVTSSPEASPRVDLQAKVNKMRAREKARAKARLTQMPRPSLTPSISSRQTAPPPPPPATQPEPVIDLTLTSESEAAKSGDEDEMPAPAKAKSVPVQDNDEEEESDSGDLDIDSDTSTEFIRPKKTSITKTNTQAAPKKPLNLKETVRSGESLAATRIKKRKPRPAGADDVDDRPLKKARETFGSDSKGKVADRKTSTSKTPAPVPKKKKSIGAAPTRRSMENDSIVVKREKVQKILSKTTAVSVTPGPSRQTATPAVASSSKGFSIGSKRASQKNDRQLRDIKQVSWPTPMQEGDPKYVDGSIECDQCKNWYHYSCVQLDQDDLDILANDDTPYYCPACSIGTAPSLYVRKKRKDDCARPDCKVRKRLEVGEFFVEAIIGRAPSAKPGEFTYLVEWRGYHIKEATWEPSLPNPMPFVRTFTAKAKQEGLDLSNPHDTVLLAVAKPHHS